MAAVLDALRLVDQRAKKRKVFKQAMAQKSDTRELWFNTGLKVRAESGSLLFPLVLKKQPRQYGEDWLLRLPVGLSEMDIRRKSHRIAAALGGSVEFERVAGGNVLMRVMTGRIGRKYDFTLVERGGLGIPLPIGYGRGGLVVLDLATAPHLLVGGTPGFGKSAFLHQGAVTMLQHGVELQVVDLKRLEFAYLKNHARVVTTEQDAVKLLQSLCREMDRRIDTLEAAGVVKVQDYQGDDMPYIAVIIDELAELQADPFFDALNRLLRLCRAVGISIIASTQRPSVKVLDGDSRAMFAARLCYQVADELNSRMVLGEAHSEAAYLPGIPGRAVWRFGNTITEVQTMWLPVAKAKQLVQNMHQLPPVPTIKECLSVAEEPEIITIT
jgi:S-DNA-T family DNA segregation ATPase FtsK/SpoIIIE